MRRPENLTDEEWAEYQQCQDEHDELMAQVADREAQMEAGLIDSYDEYEFTWEYSDPAPRPQKVFQLAQEAYEVLDPPAHRCRSAAAPPQPTTGPHQARRR